MPAFPSGRARTVSMALAVVVAVLALVGTPALARDTGVPPQMDMFWDVSNDGIGPTHYNLNTDSGQVFFDPATGEWVYEIDRFFGPGGAWQLGWRCTAIADPLVTAELTVTNNSANFEFFDALVVLSVDTPIVGGSLMSGGAAATVTNNDFFGGSAELRTAPGTPIYTGLIDTVPEATLWDDPYSLVAVGALASAADDTAFGAPTPVPGPDVSSTIAVWLRFELSPGDSATISGLFEVNAIPAPAGLAVLAGFGLLGGRRRRRR